VRRLALTDFRNHARLGLQCDGRSVVLTGENGAGKTNILEALSFLSPGRGLRRATQGEVARHAASGGWTVFAEVEGGLGPAAIGVGTEGPDAEAPRRVRINGAPAKSAEDLLAHLRLLWIAPAMDGLFAGPAAERRRFFDRLVLAIDPGHGRRVADFEKAMRARNRLLAGENPDGAWLDAIEAQMAETGTAALLARAELVLVLGGVIVREAHMADAFPDAVIGMAGTLETLAAEMPAGELEERYLEMLASGRRIDAAAGRTLEGPHRCDFPVLHREKNMPAALCSTGEQKALLIGIMLAQASLTRRIAGFAPILLLDEIAAHLDTGRREALFDRIEALDCQAWMTGADPALFAALGGRALALRVAGGGVLS
jgi:DNA replication and repair protein RecF